MKIILRNLKTNFVPNLIRMFVFVLVLGTILAQFPLPNAQARAGEPKLILTKTIEGGATTANVGDIIRYHVRFECSSLTTTCGQMEITDILQPGLTYLPPPQSSVHSDFTIAYDSLSRTVKITKTVGELQDGSQYDATIAVRVDYDLRPLPQDVKNILTGKILPPGETIWQNAVDAPAPTIKIQGVTASWGLTKTLFSPSINPTVDTNVTYRIQLCPTTVSGNVPLEDIIITDTLPAGAIFISASDGGTNSSGVVTWNIAGPVTPPDCVTRYVTIKYPSTTFSVGSDIINTASASADYEGSTGPCPDCIGITKPITHKIDTIKDVPDYTKTDAGDPVGYTGTARFILGLNTNGTNYPSNNVMLIDNLLNSTSPDAGALEVTQVTSGQWSSAFNNVRAYVEYSTNNGTNWTLFPDPPGKPQPAEYNENAVYTAPVANITNVRWRFEYDADPDGDGTFSVFQGLPYTWSFTTKPEIRVKPRATATTADAPSGATLPKAVSGTTYTNCVRVSRTTFDGPDADTNPDDVIDPCVNQAMTVRGDYVSLRTSKDETPGTGYDKWDDPNIDTFTADTSTLPGDTVKYTIVVEVTERSSAPLLDPTVLDTLPDDLIFVRAGSVRFVDGGTTTTLTNSTDYVFSESGLNPGINHTLKWKFNYDVTQKPLGSSFLEMDFYARIPAGQGDGPRTNTLHTVSDSVDVLCESGSRVADSTDIDTDSNAAEFACTTSDNYVVEKSAALRGEKWIRSIAGQNNAVSLSIPATTLPIENFTSDIPAGTCPDGGSTGLSGGGANRFTRYPCISRAYPEKSFINGQFVPPPTDPLLDDFEYNLRIFNEGNVGMIKYVLYDILPYYGDKGSGGTLANLARNSEFRVVLRGPVQFLSGTGIGAGNFTIKYSLSTTPCRPEVFNEAAGASVPTGCTNDWKTEAERPITDWTTVRAYSIRLNEASGVAIPPAGPGVNEVRFGVPMSVPADAPLVGEINNDDPQSYEIAWNSFSHVGSYETGISAEPIRDLLASEPRKVGITIPEVMSIGNRVWRDSDNSGTINPPDDTDPGIGGVIVNLYRDADNNGIPDGPAIATTVTDTAYTDTVPNPDVYHDGGYYLFSNIPYDAAVPGNNRYIVGIPAENFSSADPDGLGPLTIGALYKLRSSTGTPVDTKYTTLPVDANVDKEDHGKDPVAVNDEVFSPTITLRPNTEAPNTEVSGVTVPAEADLSDNDRDGIGKARRGVNGEANTNSDLTVDFGFFGGADIPFSIGNYLWFDNGAGANSNNGIRDNDELPVTKARVELYRDGNGNGKADGNEYIRFDVTDAPVAGVGGGFYLFDNLDPGTYFVLVVPNNFKNTSFDPDGSGTGGGPLPAAPGVLRGWYSSQVTGTEDATFGGTTTTAAIDSDDNGVDTNIPETNGVFSGAIVLTRDIAHPEPSGETHLSGQTDPGPPTNANFNPTGWDGSYSALPTPVGSRGRFGETDATSNLTVDFGFITPMSLGNRVWIDDGSTASGVDVSKFNNGIMDGTEAGVAGVRVELWRDTNATIGSLQVSGAGRDTFVRFTTTDASGYYLFDRLQPGANYFIHIPKDNFDSASFDPDGGGPLPSAPGALLNYFSSTGQPTLLPEDDADKNDNGVDNATPATNGITSQVIALAYTSEPQSEPDLSPDTAKYGANSRGLYGQADADSNLTKDFGFVLRPYSLGNYLWLDTGDGNPANNAYINNGIFNTGESPVPLGTRVSLYRDDNGDGQPDDLGATDWIAWDTTDTNGYYLFDNLPAGKYIVGVDRENFDVGGKLVGYTSSTNNVDNASNDTDSLDNGIDRALPADVTTSPYGILSTSIDLTGTPTLPAGETLSGNTSTATGNNPTAGDGSASIGRYGETDATSDLTIDFGFVDTYALGNRVWFDTNNNGNMDIDPAHPTDPVYSEVGVDNVQVQLFRADTSGNPIGSAIGTDETADGGYYMFDYLVPDDYVVVITADNFTDGGAADLYKKLVGYWSSRTVRDNTTGVPTELLADTPDPDTGLVAGTKDDDLDLDDNGTLVSGDVISKAVTLGPAGPTEPTTDSDLQPVVQHGKQSNDHSNLTVDFGFYKVSLGNLVWMDNNKNGMYDGGGATPEPFVPDGTLVSLYAANPVTGARIGAALTTTTTLNGIYNFDNLLVGNYIVSVTMAAGASSTTDSGYPTSASMLDDNTDPDQNVDSNDNGIGTAEGEVFSGVVTLTPGQGTGGSSGAVNNTVDNSSGTTIDPTVDFGFVTAFSLGNRVWFDTNNNASLGGAEVGISNVTVALYKSDGITPVYELDGITPRVVTTDANGYYLFDYLDAGDYIVVIPEDNFDALGTHNALVGYWSSQTLRNPDGSITESAAPGPNNDTDSDDNGMRQAGSGVASGIITLGVPEPTNDDDLQPGVNHGAQPDERANLTVDFGFYKVEIGNLVYEDVNANGTYDAGDILLNNVPVELLSANGTSIGAGITTNTDINGEYLFTNQPEGTYIVRVTTPAGMVSTIDTYNPTDNTDPDNEPTGEVDDNDNGIGIGPATLVNVSSGILFMDAGESGSIPAVITTNQSNGTTTDIGVDFGFTYPYALGNRVWFDTNNDGVMDTAEQPINGVQVQLFLADQIGAPTGAALGSDVTSNGGYYLFDNLTPGDYVVIVTADNFTNGGAADLYKKLVGYWSSLTSMSATGIPTEDSANTPDPDTGLLAGTVDDDLDLDDNGTHQASGDVISKAVRLGLTGLTEPVSETQTEGGTPPVGQGLQLDGRANMTVDFGFYQVSVGNLVFSDGNRNGSYLAADDVPLSQILVHLFASNGTNEIVTGKDGILGSADDTLGPDGAVGGGDDGNGGMYTDTNGLYTFGGLPAGTYIIKVNLPNGVSSTIDSFDQPDNDSPDKNTDNNDNGVDATVTLTQISSNPVTLTAGANLVTRPKNTIDDSKGSTHNPTVDFGYIPAFSLGNRVWFDTNNNGLIDTGEVGINGVVVELFNTDASGNPTTPVMVGGIALTDTTDKDTVSGKDGYYLFNPLPAGNYVVVVSSSNFTTGVLKGYWSSGLERNDNSTLTEAASPDPDSGINSDVDSDDNGMHRTLAPTGSVVTPPGDVVSKSVTLGPNPTEPENETDLDTHLPSPFQGQPDKHGNMTVDFGFYTLEIGNLVWDDLDNSGDTTNSFTPPVTETGINGVDVELWTADGLTMLGTATTQTKATKDGFYNFTGLPKGNYILRIPASEFDATGTLNTYVSSTGTNTIAYPVPMGKNEPAPAPDDNTDDDDNGTETGGTLSLGGYIQSEAVTLTPGAAGAKTKNTITNSTGATTNPTLDFGVFKQDKHIPRIGVAKVTVGTPTEVSPGTYQVVYDILVQNMGDVELVNVQVTENLDSTFTAPTSATFVSAVSTGATPLTVNTAYNGTGNLLKSAPLLTGENTTLAVGTSGTIRLTVNVVPYASGPFNNTAIASGKNPFGGATVTDHSQDGTNPDPDGDKDPTNNNVPTPVDFGPSIFDPPIGIKVFNDAGLPMLEWTMTWINSTNIAAINARVSDPIPAGTTYEASGAASGYLVPGTAPAGSTNVGVSCTSPSAATTTTECYYEMPTPGNPLGRVVWAGTLGPDFGSTNAATAVNELNITFRVNVPSGITAIYNTATIDADRNGNRVFAAAAGGVPSELTVANAQAIWVLNQSTTEGPNVRERRKAISLPSTGFAPNVVTTLPEQPADKAYFETGGVQLEIPRLGINTSVAGIPQADDGSWDVTWLWNQAGWLQGTAYPTLTGNSAITGHVYLPNGAPGPFVDVHKLAYGDKIIIHANGQKYTYEVRENKQVKPSDISVLKHEDKAWITLLTCLGYNETNNTYASRVAVRAILMTVKADATSTQDSGR